MKKFFGFLCAVCLVLSVAACSGFSSPETYSVGDENPVPSITAVVGEREFLGSSMTANGGSGALLSMACSYENIADISSDLSQYIQALTSEHGFTISTPFDAEHPEQGAVLTKPAEQEGHTLTLTIEVPDASSYRIELKSEGT